MSAADLRSVPRCPSSLSRMKFVRVVGRDVPLFASSRQRLQDTPGDDANEREEDRGKHRRADQGDAESEMRM